MSLYQGISTNYNNVRVEDVINDKTKIDSNLDVLGATYSLAQMELVKTELNGTITTLQNQVNSQAILITALQEQANENTLFIQELQNFVLALQNNS